MEFVLDSDTDKEVKPPVKLRLKREENMIWVMSGDGWYLLGFTSEGKVYRSGGIPAELGFEIDTTGRILIVEEG